MKNCNCKEKETSCKCITKQLIDECSGSRINYITLASAVLMGCDNPETVEDALNEIYRRLQRVENEVDNLDYDTILSYIKLHISNLNPELKNLIKREIENYFLTHDFAGLKTLFETVFESWENKINELLDKAVTSGIDEFTVNSLIEAALSSKNYVTKIKIDGTLYSPTNGIVDLTNAINNSTDLLKGVDFINKSLDVDNSIAKFTPDMTGVIFVKGISDRDNPDCKWIMQCKGDVNGDGVVDIADVNAVINIMLGKAEPVSAADVTGDGKIDVADVNTVINYMLGKANPNYVIRNEETHEEFNMISGLTYYNITAKSMIAVLKEGTKIDSQMTAIQLMIDEKLKNLKQVVDDAVNKYDEDSGETFEVNGTRFFKYFDHLIQVPSEATISEYIDDTFVERDSILIKNGDNFGLGTVKRIDGKLIVEIPEKYKTVKDEFNQGEIKQ